MWKRSTKREKQEITGYFSQSQHLCVLSALWGSVWQLLERSLSMAALHKGALRKSHRDEATDSWGGPSGSEQSGLTYECRPWTPPSTWADMVLFSNFSSPEYIIELHITQKAAITDTWFVKLLNQWSSKQGPTTPYARVNRDFQIFVTIETTHRDQSC